MSKTSTQAKRQWNARNYTEFRASYVVYSEDSFGKTQ